MDQKLVIQNIIEKLSQIIKDKEFILNLSNILKSVEMEHIIGLNEEIVTKFPTRNQIIVYYNPILTACTESNTAAYHLGSEQQCNNAILYIAPYCSKKNRSGNLFISIKTN